MRCAILLTAGLETCQALATSDWEKPNTNAAIIMRSREVRSFWRKSCAKKLRSRLVMSPSRCSCSPTAETGRLVNLRNHPQLRPGGHPMCPTMAQIQWKVNPLAETYYWMLRLGSAIFYCSVEPFLRVSHHFLLIAHGFRVGAAFGTEMHAIIAERISGRFSG